MVDIPSSVETEKALLNSMVIDNTCIKTVTNTITEDHFHSEKNRKIFNAIISGWKKSAENKVDYITVISEIKRMGASEIVDKEYILSIGNIDSTPYNIDNYIRDIDVEYVKRTYLIDERKILDNLSFMEVDEIIEQANDNIQKVVEKSIVKEATSIREYYFDSMKKFEEMRENPQKSFVLKSGFVDLDKKLIGLFETELIILAARPSVGKTAFALNIAYNCAEQLKQKNKNVLFFSMEMSGESLSNRLTASTSRVNQTKFREGNFDVNEFIALQTNSEKIIDLPLEIVDKPSLSVQELYRISVKTRGVGLIIVDYLQLLTSTGRSENRNIEVSKISRMLKALSVHKKVPVIALSQLSRNIEQRKEKRPMLSDLRESGSIEQDADVVIFLHRDGYQNENSLVQDTEVLIRKNRNGMTGDTTLIFQMDICKFENKAHSSFESSYNSEPDLPF